MSDLQDLKARLQAEGHKFTEQKESSGLLKEKQSKVQTKQESSSPNPFLQRYVFPQNTTSYTGDTEESSNVLNSDQVDSLLDFYLRLVSPYAKLNGRLVNDNLRIVQNGLPDDVRTMSLESFMFIANRFGLITAALILNHQDCRRVFADAIGKECDALKLSPKDRKDMHTVLSQNGGDYSSHTHLMELGFTTYDPDTELTIMEHMSNSFQGYSDSSLQANVDQAFETYSEQDAEDIGAILSNPVYLLIAFNHNMGFVRAVDALCKDVANQ